MSLKPPQLLGYTPPVLEIPARQVWYRIQRNTSRSDSLRYKGYVLAPAGSLAGRFDLSRDMTAYLADSPETALYESLFRREIRSCHIDRIAQRSLVSFETQAAMRLADLRGLEALYPVLQSMRYETSQGFAQDCHQQGLQGIVYASAQHATHSCVCLFASGIEKTKKLHAVSLVQPRDQLLHKAVIAAARGSQVPILQD